MGGTFQVRLRVPRHMSETTILVLCFCSLFVLTAGLIWLVHQCRRPRTGTSGMDPATAQRRRAEKIMNDRALQAPEHRVA